MKTDEIAISSSASDLFSIQNDPLLFQSRFPSISIDSRYSTALICIQSWTKNKLKESIPKWTSFKVSFFSFSCTSCCGMSASVQQKMIVRGPITCIIAFEHQLTNSYRQRFSSQFFSFFLFVWNEFNLRAMLSHSVSNFISKKKPEINSITNVHFVYNIQLDFSFSGDKLHSQISICLKFSTFSCAPWIGEKMKKM